MIEIILFILLWLIMYALTMVVVLVLFALAFVWLIENEPDKKIKNWLIKLKLR
jgi:Flp pilus assembly protein TadB